MTLIIEANAILYNFSDLNQICIYTKIMYRLGFLTSSYARRIPYEVPGNHKTNKKFLLSTLSSILFTVYIISLLQQIAYL